MAMLCTAARAGAATTAPRRLCVRVHASSDTSRRFTLGALAVTPLLAASKAFALTPIAIDDHTFAQKLAVSLDEMRDSNANVRTRRNAFQGEGADLTPADFQRRTKEAAKRVADVANMLSKDRVEWSKVYQEVHNATGTLRFDMSNLIASLPDKQAKKAANKLSKDAMEALEQLDLYTRKQDLTKARAWHGVALKKLQDATQPLMA